MLSLLASGPAHPRQEVARLLGVHRHTLGHGLMRDESGGLNAWLARYVPAGNPWSLPPAVLAALEQVLRPPAGFASDVERRQWIQQTQHLDVHDPTLDTLVRTRLTAQLKGPRPRHTTTPGGHS
jgi:hypothetical protein